MDTRNDIREFLTTRRARLTPGHVGLPDFGGRRRVQNGRLDIMAINRLGHAVFSEMYWAPPPGLHRRSRLAIP